jgi:drug/metabolite transporter (DMT)-like permease
VGGIALVFRDRLTANAPLLSLLAIVLAAACVAESVVLFKTFPKTHPITTNALAMAMGAAILWLMSWVWRETPQWPTLPATWLALFYLILFGSIATFVLALFVLARWSASVTSYQLVLLPIVTVLSSAWLTHETVTVAFLLGGLLVLAGVYVGAIAPSNFLLKIFPWRRKT